MDAIYLCHMVKAYKILIIGDGAVGKTSIATRYTTGGFKESHLMTVGANFMLKNIDVNGKQIRLSIWDTAGQEKFRKVVESYYTGGKGVMICFAINSRQSFESLKYWYDSAKKFVPTAQLILVGNKSDLEDQREVSRNEAVAQAEEWGLPYIETSAMLNRNISDAFLTLAKMIVEE